MQTRATRKELVLLSWKTSNILRTVSTTSEFQLPQPPIDSRRHALGSASATEFPAMNPCQQLFRWRRDSSHAVHSRTQYTVESDFVTNMDTALILTAKFEIVMNDESTSCCSLTFRDNAS